VNAADHMRRPEFREKSGDTKVSADWTVVPEDRGLDRKARLLQPFVVELLAVPKVVVGVDHWTIERGQRALRSSRIRRGTSLAGFP
jgi:hypothetical protein